MNLILIKYQKSLWNPVIKLVNCLGKISNNMRTRIETFNPDVNLLQDTHQDFLMKIRYFNAGRDYVNFNDFIAAEAVEYAQRRGCDIRSMEYYL